MEIKTLRKAQQIVCEAEFQHHKLSNGQFHGCVDDHIWNQANDMRDELSMNIDDYEREFELNPTVQTAKQYWLKASID